MAKNKPKSVSKPIAKSTTSAKKSSVSSSSWLPNSKNSTLLFDKTNYIILGVGALLIVLGYLLMIGGGSTDPNVFNPSEIYSFRRITLAPIVIIIGFLTIVVAILKKPTSKYEVSNVQ